MRNIEKIIIHCSDTPDKGDRYGFKEINQWHADRKWLDKASGISCGYHAIIRPTGTVEAGRPISSVGAHTYGHNSHSIGLCLIGRERVTLLQVDTALTLVAKWCKQFQLTHLDVKGHYEYSKAKTCPGQDMKVFRKLLKSRLEGNLVKDLRQLIVQYS